MADPVSLSVAISSLQIREEVSQAWLGMQQDDETWDKGYAFQYFPETITDPKQVNYQNIDIPGASLPLQQFSSGSARDISFTAVFTCDMDLLAPENSAYLEVILDQDKERSPDLRSVAAWLRTFTLPRYVDNKTLAPPLAFFYMKNSGIGAAGGEGGPGHSNPDGVVGRITTCDLTYQTFFPSGLPRILEASLTIQQTAQYRGQVMFPRRGDKMTAHWKGGTSSNFFGYRIK